MVLHDIVPKSSAQDADLNCPTRNQVVEANGAPRVVFEEDHEEAKANKDHDMYVLEKWVSIVQVKPRFLLPGWVQLWTR